MDAIIQFDNRRPCANPPTSRLPAFSVSTISHAALLLGLMVAFRGARESESIEPTVADPLAAPAQLVWMPVTGASGGGGGGGNRTAAPARLLQRYGADRVTTPAVRTSVVQTTEREPEPAIEIPTLPLAGDSLTLPGAIETAVFSVVSLGPGTDGAGSGRGGGDGPGDGRGKGRGNGGNFGDGPNRGGGVMPSVLRDVKPRYTAEAMRAHIQGTVLVRAIVQPDGTVGDVRILRSLDPVFGLDEEALRAASQWLFRPALMGGQRVPAAVTIELVFSLR